MAELLCEDGLEVREVTTDPDSSAGRAADSLYKDGLLGQNFSIPSSDENETMLHACFSKRLSPAVLDKTIKNSNSQKVESFNRTLRRSLPRNVTFTRNFAGRAHSAAHSCNNGPGSSLRGLCAGVGASIPSGGQVDQTLDKIQTDYELNKSYQKSLSYKAKRVTKRKKCTNFMRNIRKKLNIKKT